MANTLDTGKPGPTNPSTALYVGNLSPEVTENHLYEKFGPVGAIASVRVCRDSVSRRSLGYAYVNYTNTDHAKTAVETLNAESILDRPMRVMYSIRDPTQRRSGVGNIFIRNLAKDIDSKALLDTMAQFGAVLSVKISSDNRSGASRGYGFVQFSNDNEARTAIAKLDGMTLEGQVINVYPYKTKQERTRDMEKNFTNVFVKHLPLTFTEDNMKELFGQYGEIARHTVRKNEAGASKGYGFVEYKTHEAANAAVTKLNNYRIDDEHSLVTERALKKSERAENLKRGISRQDRQNQMNLYVKNLDDTVSDDKLRELFSPFGNIKSIRVMRDDSGRSKGFGFVSFDTQEAATKAATELNCKFYGSKPLYVAKFQNRAERTAHLQLIFRQPSMPMPYYPYGPMVVPPFQQSGFPGGRRVGGPAPGQHRFPRPPGGFAPNMGGAPRPQRTNNMAPLGGPAGAPRPPTKAPMPGMPSRHNELTASQLASLPPEAQKHTIGEHLYTKISTRHGQKAGKITGMLLEMDISELLHLMEDDEALMVKEKEALKVLTEHKA